MSVSRLRPPPSWEDRDDSFADDGRLRIDADQRLVDVVDQVIGALSSLEAFQRGGALADIVREASVDTEGVVTANGEPKIRLTPRPRVQEMISTCVRLEMAKHKKGEKVATVSEVPVTRGIVETVMARGEWRHIRPLSGLVSWPVLRNDGSLFLGPGYDISTQTYAPKAIHLETKPCVTPDDIVKAREIFDDMIGEFPFETPAHKAAWISGLLTVIARRTIDGPIPMLVIDANTPGSGKTALADTLGCVLLGSVLPRRAIPDNDEEWRKTMVGIGIAAYPIILLDNLKKGLHSAVLDAVLTGKSFQDRALGMNLEIKVDVPTLMVVTTNNATLDTDLVRRSLHVRLVTEMERPEQRTGFRHYLPDDASKPEIRDKMLWAACVILAGYHQAGRPKQYGRQMGSYDAWCRAVRDPLIWAGYDDPVSTQDELRDQADSDSEALGALLLAWFNMYGERDHDIGTILGDLREDESPNAKALASSLIVIGDDGRIPNAKKLGYKVRKWKERRVGGLRFVSGQKGNSGVKWSVQKG